MGSFGRTPNGPGAIHPAPPRLTPLPPGSCLAPDPGLRLASGGRVLIGGSPTRLIRLRPRGARLVHSWLAGQPVADRRSDGLVARRLVAAGVMHPRPAPLAPGVLVNVVVPVRDRPELLGALLESLGEVRCVVVDDCSVRQAEVEKVARDAGAEYVRLDVHSGPAAARNAGVARVLAPLVAFVDSDCVVGPGWLDGLVGHFADPRVALVAPRVITPSGPGWLARYESVRSPLDLGPLAGRVAPATRLSYVPAAAVLLRRAAVSGRPFDERLGAGEDVDLVWRLARSGWEVRYEPSVRVRHTSMVSPGPWLARRALYGSTAGPLSRRHGDAVAPARVPMATAASWALVAARRPGAAAAVALASTAVLAGRLAGAVDEPLVEAAGLTVSGTGRTLGPAAGEVARVWSPALVIAALAPRAGRLRVVAAGLLALGATRRWRTRPPMGAAAYLVARAADNLAYGTGVWWGCLRAHTLRPLLPVVTIPRRRGDGAGGPSRGRAVRPAGSPTTG